MITSLATLWGTPSMRRTVARIMFHTSDAACTNELGAASVGMASNALRNSTRVLP